jgi:RsiW-degrading membrane proteinase PrsW (M82 family)
LLDAFQRVIDRASVTVTDPNQLLVELGPVFSDPVVLVLILGLVALAVPLIEELFKPIGVWMLLGRGLTPARGFVLGTLSGAGFALAESLAGGGIADGWLAITTARIGTSALHILTSGLMGWALVMAKSKGRYLLVVLTYLVSVSLHGLWNGMVIIGSFASLSIVAGANLLPLHLAVSSWLVLLVLAAGCIILLIFNNRTLRDAETSPGSV